jgi:hypothetical protein
MSNLTLPVNSFRARTGAPHDDFLTLDVYNLPKGGGAIRGMGEKFAANPVTGTGSMSVPIATSPGRSGFGPQLSLSYDSGAGNGPFGFGWSLSSPSITRKTDKGLAAVSTMPPSRMSSSSRRGRPGAGSERLDGTRWNPGHATRR